MRFYSTGEAAKKLGVSRDSLFSALRTGAPDTKNRIGGRRIFSETEVNSLEAWYKTRDMMKDGTMSRESGVKLDENRM